jgi:tetratricopeptide (TPR) repeat protein
MSQLASCLDHNTFGDETNHAVNNRFFCDNVETIRALVVRALGTDSAAVEASLVDISQSGVKLLLDANFPQGEPLELEFRATGVELPVFAVVRWCKPTRGDQWNIGCEFTSQLDEDQLTQLAEAGDLERRRSPRRDTNVFTTARWDSGDMSHAVLVKNVSPRGFCVISPWQAPDNGLLKITPDNEDIQITGQVCWQQKIARGYIIGCSLINDVDFFVLRELVDRLQEEGLGGEQGEQYQKMGTAALEEEQWSKAEKYFQLALEIQFSHLGDALNSAVMVGNLARIWKTSNATNLAEAIATTLEIDISGAEQMLSEALSENPDTGSCDTSLARSDVTELLATIE